MAIRWQREQRTRVKQLLKRYGVDSSRCERAAHHILPVAAEVDSDAVARRCDPAYGVYVCPTRKWVHHVNVHVSAHYVDALTDVDGMEAREYIETHWPDEEGLVWQDLTAEALKELAG